MYAISLRYFIVLCFRCIDRKFEVMQHYVFGSFSQVRKNWHLASYRDRLEAVKELTNLC